MKNLAFLLFSFGLVACGNDDTRTCTSCTSEQTTQFEVCREQNGDASVNGEDTDTNYDVYIADLIDAGASCGG